MSVDRNQFIEGYIVETQEHLDSINNAIITLKENPDNKEALSVLLRELHTIKGTSRMMGYSSIEEIAHGLEDVFKGIRESKYDLNSRIIQLVFLTCDALTLAIKKIQDNKPDGLSVSLFMNTFDKASSGSPFSIEELLAVNSKIAENNEDDVDNESSSTLGEVKSIRVKIDRINDLIHTFDNLIIREFKLKKQLEELEYEEKKTGSRQIRKIRKQFAEDLQQLESMVFNVQNKIFDLRMLPIDMILHPLKKMVEMEAINQNKEIHVDIPETDITLDKMILEPLSDILMHLLRNAVDHGIETPEERKKKGKHQIGFISIAIKSISNRIFINISDNGCGINYDKVREKAIAYLPEQSEEILAMSEKDLSSFLFMSGFSTKTETSALSGRGVGLDVVRQNIEQIKGKINFSSKKDEGTSFELSLPLSLATLQGVFITADGVKYLIPSHYIIEITNCDPSEYINLQNQNMIRLRDQILPVYSLSSVIGTERKLSPSVTNTVLIVEYLEKRIGISVTEVLRTVSVVVKPLPDVFKNFTPIQGVVFDENYSIVPILHIPDLMNRMKSLLAYDMKKYEAHTTVKENRILVVDDSYTTRQIEKTILETEGYLVETANDGIEALDKLKMKHYDAIVTDIKMPRMDGFVLIENIKRLSGYESIPIVVVSSVYDAESKKRFMDSGVQGFIVKSDFERGNLVTIVKELLHGKK